MKQTSANLGEFLKMPNRSVAEMDAQELMALLNEIRTTLEHREYVHGNRMVTRRLEALRNTVRSIEEAIGHFNNY